jgi:Spy/CpxP family protein refolding chaperone
MSGIQSVSVSAAQSYASVGAQSQQSLQPFANLDLTEAQRTQLRSIFSAAKQNGTSQADVESQVNAVLTPAQQQALASDIKAGGGHSGRHHHQAQNASTSQASPPESATSAAASPPTTILAAITNIQNQAVAAQSTILDNLQQQVLSQNGTLANE